MRPLQSPINEEKRLALSGSRDLSLDLLRGGAILFIVGYHHIQNVWMLHLPGNLSAWLSRVALALFCFLSGLLLGRGNAVENASDAGRFLKRRFLRIYPLYLIALSIFLTLDLIPQPLFWPSALLLNTCLGWDLLTLWFISMIFLFYLVTPLFLYRPSPGKTLLLSGGILGGSACLHVFFQWIDPRFFANFPAFAFGIFLSQQPHARDFFLRPSSTALLASASGLLFLAVHTLNFPPLDASLSGILFCLAWFAAALPGLFVSARWLSKKIPPGAISFLASASFILYLSHRIFYDVGEKIFTFNGWARQFYHLLFLLPLALLFSFFLQKAYDRLLAR